MGVLTSVTTPEKALLEIKKCIKNGRDNIGRCEWQTLGKIVNDIIDLIGYLENWRLVLPYDKLPYDDRKTDLLLKLLKSDISEQIMFKYPEKNVYGYTLPTGGDTWKRRSIGSNWELLEEAFGMRKSYAGTVEREYEGVFDKYERKTAVG